MTEDPARVKLLQMIEEGLLTPQEGLRLLDAFDTGSAWAPESPESSTLPEETASSVPSGSSASPESAQPAQSPPDADFETQPIRTVPDSAAFSDAADAQRTAHLKKVKKWWLLPFFIGLLFTLLGAVWMYLGYSAKGLGWGFWLSWFPFGFGVALMVLAALSSRCKWIYLKIHEKSGSHPTNIKLAFPIPVRMARWSVDKFGKYMPQDIPVPVDQILSVLDADITPEAPFYVNVDDDDDDVEIFIG